MRELLRNIELISFTALLLFLPLTAHISMNSSSGLWNFWPTLTATVLWIILLLPYVKYYWTAQYKFGVLMVLLGVLCTGLVFAGLWKRDLLFLGINIVAVTAMLLVGSRIKSSFGVDLLLVLISLIGSIYAIWGLGQFAGQSDFGLFRIGESQLSAHSAGVAKFMIASEKIVRPYGPFAHSNSFGGALVVCAVAGIVTFLRIKTRALLYPVAVTLLGVLFTFSRSTWISLAVLLIIASLVFAKSYSRMVLVRIGAIFLMVILILSPLIMYRLSDAEDRGISERVSQILAAKSIIINNGLWNGVGVTKYVQSYEHLLVSRNVAFEEWQIVPVHSVPVLLAAELGVLPFVLIFSAFIVAVYARLKTQWYWLLPLVPLAVFDHYLVTQTAPAVLGLLLVFLLEPPEM